MSQVFRPGARENVPVGQLEIDWTHPLANGLVACFLPGVSAGINLAGGGDLSPVNAAGTVTLPAVSKDGPGWKTAKSGDGLRAIAIPAFKSNQVSLYWRGTIDTTSNDGVILFGMDYDNAVSSPYTVATIQTTFAGGAGPTIEMDWNSGGTGHSSTPVSITGTAGDGSINSFLATFQPGGNAILYKSGAQVSSVSFGASNPTYTATSVVGINSENADNNRNLGATAVLACMWNRILSADEAAALNLDPYCFLIPAEGEMPALFLSAANDTFANNKQFRFM